MIRLFDPVKDASVYEEFPTRNTGVDEILEVGKNESGAKSIRSIIAFDMSVIASVAPSASVYLLRLNTATAKRLENAQPIRVSTYTGSWAEGTGYFYQDLYQVPDGIVWTALSGTYNPSASITGSVPWHDLTIDVTSLVSGTTGIQSLVIQFPSSSEASINSKGNIRFHSRNTHTIWGPVLEVRTVSQSYATGSLTGTTGVTYLAAPHSLKASYTQGETARVGVTVREKYPLKTFTTILNTYVNTLYVPPTTYFSVVDDVTGYVVIPFSDGTRLQQTAVGAYFTFVVENMHPRRFYRVILKVSENGNDQVFDNRFIFKVTD